MEVFEREEPDGYPESGYDWMDTQSLLERMKFAQGLADGAGYSASDWDVADFMSTYSVGTAEELIDLFDEILFGGTLPEARRAVLLDFVNSDDLGNTSEYTSLSRSRRETRLGQMVALLLSVPEFQFQ
jgi:hypothetical protein